MWSDSYNRFYNRKICQLRIKFNPAFRCCKIKGNAFKTSPASNQRLTVGLQPLGKASAQHAIEAVVESEIRPTHFPYDWEIILKAVPKKKVFYDSGWEKALTSLIFGQLPFFFAYTVIQFILGDFENNR
jgi:hypothetical protein